MEVGAILSLMVSLFRSVGMRFACVVWAAVGAFACGPVTEAPPARSAVDAPADDDDDGIADADDACPAEPEDRDAFEDGDGCPDIDNDEDGVPDVDDVCMNEASHRSPAPAGMHEGVPLGCPAGDPEYSDGPPGDMDDDGYADAVDRCPNHAETFPSRIDGGCTDDGDGCPDGTAILLVDCRIMILEVLHFESRAGAPPESAAPVIDAIAQVLETHADLRLEVIGHVDGREPASLGRARAETVRDALIARGVAAERLSVRDAGTSEPAVAPRAQSTALTRAQNRRVSFAITARRRLPGRPLE